MVHLPSKLLLTRHAKQRLEERSKINNYNMIDLMQSNRKWYTRDDLKKDSGLYVHSRYLCRKAKDKFEYLTDGNIEVLYDKNTNVVITILSLKEKFLPITNFIIEGD